ncbi:MAG: hypothetical protein JNL98_34115 [Bryobacterales bacterium]|nr:hypothetical protein [Bryobacterales bacterium]
MNAAAWLLQPVRLSAVPAALLLIALWRTPGNAARISRLALWILLAAGVNDSAMTILGARDAIRIDLVLLFPLITIANLVGGVMAWRCLHARRMRLVAILPMALGVAGVMGLVASAVDSASVSRRLDLQRRLLFQAPFRDGPTFARVFGDIGNGDSWTGHFTPAREPVWMTRLIVNREGKVWLYCRIQNTEQLVGTGTMTASTPVTFAIEGRMPPEKLRLVLKPIDGDWEATLASSYADPDPRVRGIRIRRSEPPRFPQASQPNDMITIGVFSHLKPMEQHQRLIQLWLWADETEVWGCYLRTIQLAGSRAEFLHPVQFRARRERNGAVSRFRVKTGMEELSAVIGERGVDLRVVYNGSPLENVTLEPGAVVKDEIFDLAPTWSRKENEQWLEAVLTGRFVKWDVPAVAR